MFVFKDKSGKIIHLNKERWQHIISEHPEIFNELQNLELALRFPTATRRSEHDDKVIFYYRHNKIIRERFLMVVVKYLNNHGFIITSFYTNKIKGEK